MIQRVEDVESSRIKSVFLRRDQVGCQGRYAMSDRGYVLRIEEIQRRMQFLIATRVGPDLSTKRILEIGSGSGYWLRQFIQWGARPEKLFGIELLPERIAKARELCPSEVYLECQDASRLNFEDRSFDLVLQATVFTSILDFKMKKAIAGEIQRLLRPGGCLLWYDYFISNPWNSDMRGVKKNEILQLFPGFHVHLERVTLAPPLGKILGRISSLAYQIASEMRVFCTHYLGLIEKV